jgi:hypothetical protein
MKTSLGRKNGRSWRIKLELEAPEPNMLEVIKAIDSEIEAGMNFEAEHYGFTI